MKMPATPFPVSGWCFDSDESTILTSGEIHATNITKVTTMKDSIRGTGEYTIDLANLSGGAGVSNGDVIEVVFITDGDKMGFFRFTADTSVGYYNSDVYLQYVSDFQRILQDHGENVTVSAVTVSTDSDGHTSTSTTDYLLFAIPLMVSDTSNEFKEGLLNLGDLTVMVSYNDSNKRYVVVDNRITWDGKTYEITSRIKEKGLYPGRGFSHYELFCRRID